jgi:hypothetical protein
MALVALHIEESLLPRNGIAFWQAETAFRHVVSVAARQHYRSKQSECDQ